MECGPERGGEVLLCWDLSGRERCEDGEVILVYEPFSLRFVRAVGGLDEGVSHIVVWGVQQGGKVVEGSDVPRLDVMVSVFQGFTGNEVCSPPSIGL